MKEIDRRAFLKLGISCAAGVVAGEFMSFVGSPVEKAARKITNHPIGNSGTNQKIEIACENNENPQACAQNYRFTSSDKVRGTLFMPILEEGIFRAFPSYILSSIEDRKNPDYDVMLGTEGVGMTRREIMVGTISSLMFGILHNVGGRKKFVDTRTIPVFQTMAGMGLWYLQRKFGVVSNTLAHIWVNFRVFN